MDIHQEFIPNGKYVKLGRNRKSINIQWENPDMGTQRFITDGSVLLSDKFRIPFNITFEDSENLASFIGKNMPWVEKRVNEVLGDITDLSNTQREDPCNPINEILESFTYDWISYEEKSGKISGEQGDVYRNLADGITDPSHFKERERVEAESFSKKHPFSLIDIGPEFKELALIAREEYDKVGRIDQSINPFYKLFRNKESYKEVDCPIVIIGSGETCSISDSPANIEKLNKAFAILKNEKTKDKNKMRFEKYREGHKEQFTKILERSKNIVTIIYAMYPFLASNESYSNLYFTDHFYGHMFSDYGPAAHARSAKEFFSLAFGISDKKIIQSMTDDDTDTGNLSLSRFYQHDGMGFLYRAHTINSQRVPLELMKEIGNYPFIDWDPVFMLMCGPKKRDSPDINLKVIYKWVTDPESDDVNIGDSISMVNQCLNNGYPVPNTNGSFIKYHNRLVKIIHDHDKSFTNIKPIQELIGEGHDEKGQLEVPDGIKITTKVLTEKEELQSIGVHLNICCGSEGYLESMEKGDRTFTLYKVTEDTPPNGSQGKKGKVSIILNPLPTSESEPGETIGFTTGVSGYYLSETDRDGKLMQIGGYKNKKAPDWLREQESLILDK